jgi:DNA 3'-phosphatase
MNKIVALFVLFISLSARAEINRQTFLAEIPHQNKQIKVAFFDADSTLRVSKSGSPSANGPTDFIRLPNTTKKIAELNKEGYLVVIVSNQGGIPKFITLAEADLALNNMIAEYKEEGAIIHYYDFAENDDEFRKPGIGMAELLKAKLENLGFFYDVKKSFMVGDSAYKRANPKKNEPAEKRPDGRDGFNFSNSDRYFAQNANLTFYEPQYYFGWADYGVELIENTDDLKRLLKSIEDLCRTFLSL